MFSFMPFRGILVVASEGENGSQIDFWALPCTQHSVTETPKMMLLRGSCAPAQPLPRPDLQPLEPDLAERVRGVPICSLWPLGSCI